MLADLQRPSQHTATSSSVGTNVGTGSTGEMVDIPLSSVMQQPQSAEMLVPRSTATSLRQERETQKLQPIYQPSSSFEDLHGHSGGPASTSSAKKAALMMKAAAADKSTRSLLAFAALLSVLVVAQIVVGIQANSLGIFLQ